MQAASDSFLGWSQGPRGRHIYVRQLRDMKFSVEIDLMDDVFLPLTAPVAAQGAAARKTGSASARATTPAGRGRPAGRMFRRLS